MRFVVAPSDVFTISAAAPARDGSTVAVYITVVGQPDRGVHYGSLTVHWAAGTEVSRLEVTVS
jgi:hypothetical protein